MDEKLFEKNIDAYEEATGEYALEVLKEDHNGEPIESGSPTTDFAFFLMKELELWQKMYFKDTGKYKESEEYETLENYLNKKKIKLKISSFPVMILNKENINGRIYTEESVNPNISKSIPLMLMSSFQEDAIQLGVATELKLEDGKVITDILITDEQFANLLRTEVGKSTVVFVTSGIGKNFRRWQNSK